MDWDSNTHTLKVMDITFPFSLEKDVSNRVMAGLRPSMPMNMRKDMFKHVETWWQEEPRSRPDMAEVAISFEDFRKPPTKPITPKQHSMSDMQRSEVAKRFSGSNVARNKTLGHHEMLIYLLIDM